MLRIDVPVPPMLEQAVGYHGDARFFAIYWGAGDEAYFNDGRTSATGHPHGYLCYIRHPAVGPELSRVNMGSSDYEAESWIVIDRRHRRAYVASVLEARRFLREQWNETAAAVPAVLSQEEFAAVFEKLRQDFESRPMPTAAEIMAAMREQQKLEAEMVAWLDATPQAQRAREPVRKLKDGDDNP